MAVEQLLGATEVNQSALSGKQWYRSVCDMLYVVHVVVAPTYDFFVDVKFLFFKRRC